MKFTKNQFIWLAVLFFSCFLIYTYWETVVSICNTIFVASQPFLVGAGIAFVVKDHMMFLKISPNLTCLISPLFSQRGIAPTLDTIKCVKKRLTMSH